MNRDHSSSSGRSIAAVSWVTLATAAAAVAAPPSTRPTGTTPYRLSVGQELTYTTTTAAKPDTFHESGTRTVTFRVVGRTSDGAGWHVVVRRPGERAGDAVSAFDLWPDGRQSAEPTRGMPPAPAAEFPPRPPTPAADRWEAPTPDGRQVYRAAPSTRPATVRFTVEEQSVMNQVYLTSQTETDTFDTGRGLVVHAKGQMSQDYGFHIRATWTRDLTGDRMRPTDETAQYAAEVATALGALGSYHRAMSDAAQAADPAQAAQAALDTLKAPQPTVKDSTLAAMLTEAAGEHGEYLREMTEEKKAHDAVVGQPAPAFDLVDLDGRRHALADLRGQVVVLDFWYRGCGWCMRAMPQVKQLAEEYKGRPVVFFGMNNDRDAKDAKFVADLFQLPYPTLLMMRDVKPPPAVNPHGASQDYHVQGYPTTFVVGPDGVVREMDVGYSPTLHDNLKRVIDKVLANTSRVPAAAP